MPDVQFHVVDLLAPPDALHQYGAILLPEGGLYVVNDEGRFRRTPYNGATDAGALYRHCTGDQELRSTVGLEADSPNQPHRVTVAFRELRPVAALVATSRTPGRAGGGDVGLRLLWAGKPRHLDPGLAEQYSDQMNKDVTGATILTHWAEREGWPPPSAHLVRELGTVTDLRKFQPRQGTKRATPEQLLKLRPIEIELGNIMGELEIQLGDQAPTLEQVTAEWMSRPGTANQQVKQWRDRHREPAHVRAAQRRALVERHEVTPPQDVDPAQVAELPTSPTVAPPPPAAISAIPDAPPFPPMPSGATVVPAQAGDDTPQPTPPAERGKRTTVGGLFGRAAAAWSARRARR